MKLIDKLIGKKNLKPGTSLQQPSLKELRWKTAMSRTELSKPARLMLELGHLTEEESHFDYGCGKGGDIERLKARGYQSTGWDPHFFPNNPIQEADIVTCLFVLNVIEDIPERLETMVKATKLARKKAILSVRVEKPPDITFSWGDGYITSQGCFQKQFTNGEFLGIIRQYFQQEPEIIAPGIAVINRE
ncbi:MAG: DNA phosphorothioation-associated putative methyltransferase [Xenococcaceae cyanobacterium]